MAGDIFKIRIYSCILAQLPACWPQQTAEQSKADETARIVTHLFLGVEAEND
jgi:hypothetical protein